MPFEIDRDGLPETPTKKLHFTDQNGNSLSPEDLKKMDISTRSNAFVNEIQKGNFPVAIKYYEAGIKLSSDFFGECLTTVITDKNFNKHSYLEGFGRKMLDHYFSKIDPDGCKIIKTLVKNNNQSLLTRIEIKHGLTHEGMYSYFSAAIQVHNKNIMHRLLHSPDGLKILQNKPLLGYAISCHVDDETLKMLCEKGAALDVATLLVAVRCVPEPDLIQKCLNYGATTPKLRKKDLFLLLTFAKMSASKVPLKTLLKHWPLQDVSELSFKGILRRHDMQGTDETKRIQQYIKQELTRRSLQKLFIKNAENPATNTPEKLRRIRFLFMGLAKSRHPSLAQELTKIRSSLTDRPPPAKGRNSPF